MKAKCTLTNRAGEPDVICTFTIDAGRPGKFYGDTPEDYYGIPATVEISAAADPLTEQPVDLTDEDYEVCTAQLLGTFAETYADDDV